MHWITYFSILTMFLCAFGYVLKPVKRFGFDADDLGAMIISYSVVMIGFLSIALGLILETSITYLSVFTVIGFLSPPFI